MTYLYRVIMRYGTDGEIVQDFGTHNERTKFILQQIAYFTRQSVDTFSFECYKIHPVTKLRV